jgi:hypothetical protein
MRVSGGISLTDPKSLRGKWVFVCGCLSEGVRYLSDSYLEVGPCLPFYSFQGEGSGYIYGKKVKWRKDKRKKQKRWPRVRPSSSLSGVSSFPGSAEMQRALIFWPLHPLVQHVVAMLCPV